VKYDASVRRAAIALVGLLGLGLGACTTFGFPAPSGLTDSDASTVDATIDSPADAPAADGGGTSLLDPMTAARLCALTFQCPDLAQAIEVSVVVPLATPPTPLNFSGCMDWLAGPIDPGRVGLALQRQVLQGIASAVGCPAAYGASPVEPVLDAGMPCASASACSSAGDLVSCSTTGTFSVPCNVPLFDTPATCDVTQPTGTALCIAGGTCTPGLSCRSSTTFVDCYKDGTSFTAYDCSLSGRQCVDKGAADCVVPGKLAAPCPGRGADDECDGTAVKHCAGGLLAETEFDCAAVGRTCSTANGVARCVSSTDQCTPFDTNGDVNACGDGGASISLCIGGQRSWFDCSSIGRSCVPASNTQTAHCG